MGIYNILQNLGIKSNQIYTVFLEAYSKLRAMKSVPENLGIIAECLLGEKQSNQSKCKSYYLSHEMDQIIIQLHPLCDVEPFFTKILGCFDETYLQTEFFARIWRQHRLPRLSLLYSELCVVFGIFNRSLLEYQQEMYAVDPHVCEGLILLCKEPSYLAMLKASSFGENLVDTANSLLIQQMHCHGALILKNRSYSDIHNIDNIDIHNINNLHNINDIYNAVPDEMEKIISVLKLAGFYEEVAGQKIIENLNFCILRGQPREHNSAVLDCMALMIESCSFRALKTRMFEESLALLGSADFTAFFLAVLKNDPVLFLEFLKMPEERINIVDVKNRHLPVDVKNNSMQRDIAVSEKHKVKKCGARGWCPLDIYRAVCENYAPEEHRGRSDDFFLREIMEAVGGSHFISHRESPANKQIENTQRINSEEVNCENSSFRQLKREIEGLAAEILPNNYDLLQALISSRVDVVEIYLFLFYSDRRRFYQNFSRIMECTRDKEMLCGLLYRDLYYSK
ncbi:hypothetical protein ENBRE01_2841 [Enteropsectra breve]|nr:hypothetical protein ENBRE01_2841 [Enteropsectra breve]